MELHHVLSLKESVRSVFESFSQWTLSYDDPRELCNPVELEALSVAIGMTGDYLGYVYLSMDTGVSRDITAQMLGGMEVTEIDELVCSAIGELSNMIMGNSCAQFCSEGYQVDITPPTVITGPKLVVSNDTNIYRIPVQIETVGRMHFDVAIRQRRETPLS